MPSERILKVIATLEEEKAEIQHVIDLLKKAHPSPTPAAAKKQSSKSESWRKWSPARRKKFKETMRRKAEEKAGKAPSKTASKTTGKATK